MDFALRGCPGYADPRMRNPGSGIYTTIEYHHDLPNKTEKNDGHAGESENDDEKQSQTGDGAGKILFFFHIA